MYFLSQTAPPQLSGARAMRQRSVHCTLPHHRRVQRIPVQELGYPVCETKRYSRRSTCPTRFTSWPLQEWVFICNQEEKIHLLSSQILEYVDRWNNLFVFSKKGTARLRVSADGRSGGGVIQLKFNLKFFSIQRSSFLIFNCMFTLRSVLGHVDALLNPFSSIFVSIWILCSFLVLHFFIILVI